MCAGVASGEWAARLLFETEASRLRPSCWASPKGGVYDSFSFWVFEVVAWFADTGRMPVLLDGVLRSLIKDGELLLEPGGGSAFEAHAVGLAEVDEGAGVAFF